MENVGKLETLISTGINDNQLIYEVKPVDVKDYDSVVSVEKMIGNILKNLDNELLRDSYMICIYANYMNIIKKYYSWFTNYLYMNEAGIPDMINAGEVITSIDVYENVFIDDDLTKKMYILNDSKLLSKYNSLKLYVEKFKKTHNNTLVEESLLYSLLEYKDLVYMYYPELRDVLEANFDLAKEINYNKNENKENNQTR